jgi:hypothetical protein
MIDKEQNIKIISKRIDKLIINWDEINNFLKLPLNLVQKINLLIKAFID